MSVTVSHSRPVIIPVNGIGLQAISSTLVILRLYARFSKRTGGRPGLDDIFLVVGWTFGTVLTVLAVYGSLCREYANHIGDVTPADRVYAAFLGWLIEIFFMIALPCVKIAIFLFYHNLTKQMGYKRLLWPVRAMLVLLFCYMVTFTVLPIAGCAPIQASWRRVDPNFLDTYACLDTITAATVAGSLNSFTDAIAAVIPLILVYIWDKPLKQKLPLYSLLSLGFVVTGAGIARTILMRQLMASGLMDWTWKGSLVDLAAIWELHLAVICACAPFILPAFREICPRVQSFSLWIRFMRGQSLHATKPLNDSKASDRSLRKSFMTGQRMDIICEKTTAMTEKDIEKQQSPSVDDAVITVALQPSQRPSVASTHDLEMQSPTLGPAHKYRLSGLSCINGATTRWSGLQTPGTHILQDGSSGQTSPQFPRSPASSRFGSISRNLGLSESVVFEDAPEVPELLVAHDMRPPEPALSPRHVACRGCGQYHPYGFQHGVESPKSPVSPLSPFFLFSNRKSRRRPSQSTFFVSDDEDDDERPVI